MKKGLLASLIFISLSANAQSSTLSASQRGKPALVYEKYGYLQGVRLDSLPSKYIQVSVEGGTIYIDYGQRASYRQQQLTDSEGLKIKFDGFWTNGLGALFNFLDYNGWDYVDNWVSQNPKYSDKFFVFKKKG